MRRCLAALGAALVITPLCGARAQQVDVTLDAGVANAAYDQYSRSSAFVIAPTIVATGTRGSIEARSALSLFEGGSRSIQAGGAGRLTSASRRGLSVELVGDLGATVYNDVSPILAGRADVLARYRLDELWQVTAGPTVGFVASSPDARGLVGFTAGVWAGDARGAYGCRVSPAQVGPLAYADTELWGGWARGRVELGGTAGVRAGDVGAGARAWFNGAAAVWLTPRHALTVGLGAYPADIVQGVPGGRFATLAVRLRTPHRRGLSAASRSAGTLARVITRARDRASEPAPGAASTRDFTVTPVRVGSFRLRLRAPGAGRVELMGDFTNWEPVPLTRDARGRWQVVLPIAPGSRRFNVRVDGGPWAAPGGVATVEDDYGGVVGVLSVMSRRTRLVIPG